MEKTVEVVLNNEKDIEIKVNGDIKHIIPYDERTIKAIDIFNILKISSNDNLILKDYQRNQNYNKDNDAAEYFHELLYDIIEAIKKTQENENNNN